MAKLLDLKSIQEDKRLEETMIKQGFSNYKVVGRRSFFSEKCCKQRGFKIKAIGNDGKELLGYFLYCAKCGRIGVDWELYNYYSDHNCLL